MAMEVSSVYGSYVSNFAYTARTGNQKQTTESGEANKTSSETTRSTAADELAYLSKKYSGYSFVAGVYQKGTKFGSSNTTNVMIDSQFLTKMANDSNLEAEYEKQIALLADLDNQMKSYYASQGWSCECGTVIDKDGEMSGWTIVTRDPNAKSHLQAMSENAEKIRKQNEEKRHEKAELAEKRQLSKEEKAELTEKMQAAGRALFGDRFKEVIVFDVDDTSKDDGRNEKEAAVGINLDTKI